MVCDRTGPSIKHCANRPAEVYSLKDTSSSYLSTPKRSSVGNCLIGKNGICAILSSTDRQEKVYAALQQENRCQ